MFIPFISRRSTPKTRNLEKRKGGGGRGGGGGGGGKSGGSRGSSSGSGKGASITSLRSKTGTVSSGSSFGGGSGKMTTTTYSSNVARVPAPVIIPAGQPFAGRSEGGAGRSQIYGTRIYGSGYPGVTGRGTLGRGFPFFFWPVVWPASLGAGYLTYLIASRNDYGDTTNSTRPGGPLFVATFSSSATTNPAINFHLLADNFTVHSLVEDLAAECSSKHLLQSIDSIRGSITAFADSNTSIPRPENVIQYYRASSVALALDGYNNTATFSDSDSVDTAIAGLGDGDWELLKCLNTTVGAATPLVSSGSSWRAPMASSGALSLPLVVSLVLAVATMLG